MKKVSFPEQLDRKRDTQRLTHTHNAHLQTTTHTKYSTKIGVSTITVATVYAETSTQTHEYTPIHSYVHYQTNTHV
jgi:hypothetical protein